MLQKEKLLATYTNLPWGDGPVYAWAGEDRNFPPHAKITSVCGFLISPDQQFVAVNVKKRGWDLPGGHLEGNETYISAFMREVKEETNIDLDDAELKTSVLGYFHLPSENNIMVVVLYFFDTPTWNKENGKLGTNVPHEIAQVTTFPINTHQFMSKIWYPFQRMLATNQFPSKN